MGSSTTEGVFDPFQPRALYGALASRVYIRECFPGWNRSCAHGREKRTSEVGIAVSIKAPPAREARGVGLPRRCANARPSPGSIEGMSTEAGAGE